MPYPAGIAPSQRARIEQWMPYLLEVGIDVDIVPFADERLVNLWHQPGRRMAKAAVGISAFVRRSAHLAAVPQCDVVLIHRALCFAGPALLEYVVALFGKPVIYDFDDAIFNLHTMTANRRFGWMKFPGKTSAICRLSSHVVVGNDFLANYANRFNSRVTIIPSSIDTDRYLTKTHSNKNGRVVVGWMGSSTSQTYLEWFAPVLKALMAAHDFELCVVSDRQPELPGVPHLWRRWSADTEVSDLNYFDIGIMPMPDDDWARGKCAFKALQYMACGVPAICSAVGANCEVIQSGENGFLAATPEEWLTHLGSLIDSPELRAGLGSAGRQTVEQRYSMRRCAARFAQVVRETVEARATNPEVKRWFLQKSKSSAR